MPWCGGARKIVHTPQQVTSLELSYGRDNRVISNETGIVKAYQDYLEVGTRGLRQFRRL
jgi:hypothetical protein